MKYIRDTVHGFQERPHFEAAELDTMFERAIATFLKKKYGIVRFPITSDDLTTLIEQDVSDLDQYADLTSYGPNVEGMTEFSRSKKPMVRISESVHRYENRLRTTLTHEYGHVVLHTYLFAMADRTQLKLGPNQKPNAIYCKRDNMLPFGQTDWMEWQAGYASGAALMPKSYVIKVVGEIQERFGNCGLVSAESKNGQELISALVDSFQVSRDAAKVRLKVLRFVEPEQASRSLFA